MQWEFMSQRIINHNPNDECHYSHSLIVGNHVDVFYKIDLFHKNLWCENYVVRSRLIKKYQKNIYGIAGK